MPAVIAPMADAIEESNGNSTKTGSPRSQPKNELILRVVSRPTGKSVMRQALALEAEAEPGNMSLAAGNWL
jgi:hypothetical protein